VRHATVHEVPRHICARCPETSHSDPDYTLKSEEVLIQDYAGASWRAVSGRSAIESDLLSAGNGARGIVYGTDGMSAHVWNAVVQRGKVNFVDFQDIGPNGAASFDSWNSFYFVRTN
jgi:hypothetical protein